MKDICIIYTDNSIVILSLLIMIFFYLFKPKKINSWYGYRTKKSVENQEQWNLAQKYSSTLSLLLLSILVFIQFIVYKILENDIVSGFLTTFLWILTFIVIIYKTEKKLKRTASHNKQFGKRAS